MRPGSREWRERFARDQRRFDRLFTIAFPIALVLGFLSVVVTIVLWAGAAAWLWSVVP